MEKLKYALFRFMYKRNGFDDLSRAILSWTLVLCVISLFVRNSIFNAIVLAILTYNMFRVFSKNISARRKENEKFLYFLKPYAIQYQQRKTHVVFRCKNCGQIIRVPKGKGKIDITCPKCRTIITKRT
ncbi:MAG: hypothetical protein KBT48_06185 [Firmicutes bacterium]|nr:hypothetical protein [Bacillota bacterium]